MHSLKRSSLRGETKLLFVLLIAFLLLGGLFFSLLYKDFQRVKTFYVKKEEFQKEIQSLKKEEKEKHSFFKKIIESWKKDIETLKKLLSHTEVKKEGKSFLYKGKGRFYNLDVLSSAIFGSPPSDTFLVLANSSFKVNLSLELNFRFFEQPQQHNAISTYLHNPLYSYSSNYQAVLPPYFFSQSSLRQQFED